MCNAKKFQVVTTRDPQRIEGWTNHISGAAALLEHRGDKDTPVGLGLFLHLRYQIVRVCYWSKTRRLTLRRLSAVCNAMHGYPSPL